jgi:hypothetical protein
MDDASGSDPIMSIKCTLGDCGGFTMHCGCYLAHMKKELKLDAVRTSTCVLPIKFQIEVRNQRGLRQLQPKAEVFGALDGEPRRRKSRGVASAANTISPPTTADNTHSGLSCMAEGRFTPNRPSMVKLQLCGMPIYHSTIPETFTVATKEKMAFVTKKREDQTLGANERRIKDHRMRC